MFTLTYISATISAEDVPLDGLNQARAELMNSLDFERVQSLNESDFVQLLDKALDDYRIRIRIYYDLKEKDTSAARLLHDVVNDARRYILTYYKYIKTNEESKTKAADFSQVVSIALDDVNMRVAFYHEDEQEAVEDPRRYLPSRRRPVIIYYDDEDIDVTGDFSDDFYDDYYRSYYRRGYRRRLAPGYRDHLFWNNQLFLLLFINFWIHDGFGTGNLSWFSICSSFLESLEIWGTETNSELDYLFALWLI